MKKNKISPIVIDVRRDGLSLCSEVHLEPLVFKFTPEMVTDMEVVGKEELKNKLGAYIVQNNVKPAPMVIVLEDSTCFVKEFSGSMEPGGEDIQKFVDAVPFASVSSKLFRVGNGYKLVVINRDLYETVQQVFEKLQFSVLAVVPGFVLGVINAPTQFTAETCRIIYRKLDVVLGNSFSGGEEMGGGEEKEKGQSFWEKHKALVLILVGALVVFAGVMAWIMLEVRPKQQRAMSQVTKPEVKLETVVTPTTVMVEKKAVDLGELRARVLNGSGVAGRAASWEGKLVGWGVGEVETGNAPAGVTTTTVTFSEKVPEEWRRTVWDELVKEWGKVNEASGAGSGEFDVEITLGKIPS